MGTTDDPEYYFLYEDGEFDNSRWIKLDGLRWKDQWAQEGGYTRIGDDIIFYQQDFIFRKKVYEGTFQNDMLIITEKTAKKHVIRK